jgi:integrase
VVHILGAGQVHKTFDEYVRRLNQVGKEFGHRPLCEISEDEILDYRAELAEKISKVTSNRSLFILKQVFQHGLKVGAINDDPAISISYLSEKEHERNAFLLPADLERLVTASQKVRAKFYLPSLIYLGAEHGASKQEALSLKWSDIHFDFGEKGIIRLYRTKNKRERTEYLMPRTRGALLDWRGHQAWMRHKKKIDANGSDSVFCRLDGTRIETFNKAWRAVCDIAGLEDFHFHDLRHTFCSNARLAGADLKDVKEMIGHRDLSMTDRYSHITPARKLSLQEALAEHYSNGAKS